MEYESTNNFFLSLKWRCEESWDFLCMKIGLRSYEFVVFLFFKNSYYPMYHNGF